MEELKCNARWLTSVRILCDTDLDLDIFNFDWEKSVVTDSLHIEWGRGLNQWTLLVLGRHLGFWLIDTFSGLQTIILNFQPNIVS